MRRPVQRLPPADALALRRWITSMVMREWATAGSGAPIPAVSVERELDRVATVWVAANATTGKRWAKARLGRWRTQDLAGAMRAAIYLATHADDARTREAAWVVARTIRGDVEGRRFRGRVATLRPFDHAEAWLAHHYSGDAK